MLFARYDITKRTKIIICSPDIEELENLNIENDTIAQMIKNRYESTIFDIPYHYIIFDDEVLEVKSPDLAHNSFDYFKSYNNDIKILVAKKEYYTTSRQKIIDLVAKLSSQYGILLEDNFMFIEDTSRKVILSEYNKILIESIKARNELNPMFNVCETIIDKKIVSNNDITIIVNRGQFKSLLDIANYLMIPEKIISEMNPHLNSLIRMGDTIFIPLTDSLKYKRIAINIVKDSEYLLNNCKTSIGGE